LHAGVCREVSERLRGGGQPKASDGEPRGEANFWPSASDGARKFICVRPELHAGVYREVSERLRGGGQPKASDGEPRGEVNFWPSASVALTVAE